MASLSGKADATLVRAATDAAMANVPVDVSRIHERISKSHAAMTKSVGKSWGKALKAIGEIGGALVQKAKDKKGDVGEPFGNVGVDAKKEFKDIGDITTGEIKSNLETKGLELVDKDAKNPFAGSSTFGGDDPLGTSVEKTTASIQASVSSLPKVPKLFQPLPAFDHVDRDNNTSTITVANTEQHIETLRNEISGLNDVRKAGLKEIEREAIEEGLSSEEIKIKKQKFKADHKAEKRRLNRVKDNTNNSNRRFAEFNEMLKIQLEEGNINMEASGMYGANKINFANALLSKGKPLADGSKAVQGYDDKGNMVFMYVDKNNRPIKSGGKNLTLAEGDAGSLLVQKSPKRPAVEALFDQDAIKRYQNKTKYGSEVHINAIEKVVKEQVTDKETFLDFAFMPTYGKNTLASAIHDVEFDKDGNTIDLTSDLASNFINALGSIKGDYSKENPHPYDTDGDGDFDKKDYSTEENYMKLTQRVLSGDELDISIPLLEMHYKIQMAKIFDAAYDVDNPVVVEEDKYALD